MIGFFAVGDDFGCRNGGVRLEIRLADEIGRVGILFGERRSGVFFELRQILPEHIAAVDDLAAAHVEQIDSEHIVLEVEAEDIGVVGRVGRSDALALAGLVHRDELVTQPRRQLKLHILCGRFHALGEAPLQLVRLTVEEELYVADNLPVVIDGDEALDARAEAALDVVLQARAWVIAAEVHLAAWNQEAAMDDVDKPVREIAREIRAEVSRAVLAQAARDEHLGVTVGERELDVRVGLVVAQQDVEARLALLDQVVFEREGLVLIGDE